MNRQFSKCDRRPAVFGFAAFLLGFMSMSFNESVYAATDETAMPREAVAHRDLVYSTPAGVPLKLDLFTPPGNGPWPTVLWFHGGAWKMGSRTGWPHMMFLLTHGYAVANVDYRLTQVASFPAQLDDCSAALDYLVRHADAYKLDRAKIAATGESAGGHLAALLGLTRSLACKVSAPGRIHAVIDLFGPTDLPALAALGPQWTEVLEPFAGGDVITHAAVLNAASPLHQVAPGAPPFLIFHGEKDPLVPIDQSRRFAAKLAKAGDFVQFVMVPNAGHATQQFWTDDYQKQMTEFLDHALNVGAGK